MSSCVFNESTSISDPSVFFGTSDNAVKSHIWIAVSIYVMLTIVKKRLDLNVSLNTLPQIISLILSEKMLLQKNRLQILKRSLGRSDIKNELNSFDSLPHTSGSLQQASRRSHGKKCLH